MAERKLLRPADAKNEGARRVRELLRRTTYGAIAKKLRVDESAVRLWAREKRKPTPVMRERWWDAFGWPPEIWDAAAASDAYTATSEPSTVVRPS